MGGYAYIHSRVDTRDASFWPWGITLGSKTLFSSFLFTTGLACLTPEIPCEDAMPDTSPSKNQGNIRHFGPGTRMSPSPGDRQYSFPKTLAYNKDAHQPKIEFENLLEICRGREGEPWPTSKCQHAGASGPSPADPHNEEIRREPPRMGVHSVGGSGGGR